MADPYRALSKISRKLNADAFSSRFFLKKTYFLVGEEAAKVFYDKTRFIRKGAAPEPLRATLFGKGGVQGLVVWPTCKERSCSWI